MDKWLIVLQFSNRASNDDDVMQHCREWMYSRIVFE